MSKYDLLRWDHRIEWLREQAALAFDAEGRVRFRLCAPIPLIKKGSLRTAFSRVARMQYDNRLLFGNLTMRWRHNITPQTWRLMDEFLGDAGYSGYTYLGNGGRAVAFLVKKRGGDRPYVLRVEVSHRDRQVRPNHPTVLQPYLANQSIVHEFQGVKLEVLDEILPLSRMPERLSDERLGEEYARGASVAKVFLGWGTNVTYPEDWFDYDADPGNVGVLPGGRIVSFDPEINVGDAAQIRHARVVAAHPGLTPSILRDLYGVGPR